LVEIAHISRTSSSGRRVEVGDLVAAVVAVAVRGRNDAFEGRLEARAVHLARSTFAAALATLDLHLKHLG
jgi:hypothetical protein